MNAKYTLVMTDELYLLTERRYDNDFPTKREFEFFIWGNDRISIIVSSDSLGQLDVSVHDGHSLGVDGTKMAVLQQSDDETFGGFLQGEDGGTLESEVLAESVGDLPH